MWAIRTAPRVVSKGMPAMRMAVKAAIMATTSGLFSPSYCMTLVMTWTSALKPSANMGRIERSIRRMVRISLVVGRPSRLKKPPGILPAASVFSR